MRVAVDDDSASSSTRIMSPGAARPRAADQRTGVLLIGVSTGGNTAGNTTVNTGSTAAARCAILPNSVRSPVA